MNIIHDMDDFFKNNPENGSLSYSEILELDDRLIIDFINYSKNKPHKSIDNWISDNKKYITEILEDLNIDNIINVVNMHTALE